MKIANQHIVRVAAMLALAAATTSAFAQNGDYRRGYEEGERSARYDRGGNSGWGRVHIEEAEYGARGAMCDARRAVWREVERTGVVHAGNQLCGDPAVNIPKRLRIIYRCGDGEPLRAFAHENETLRLSCRR